MLLSKSYIRKCNSPLSIITKYPFQIYYICRILLIFSCLVVSTTRTIPSSSKIYLTIILTCFDLFINYFNQTVYTFFYFHLSKSVVQFDSICRAFEGKRANSVCLNQRAIYKLRSFIYIEKYTCNVISDINRYL